jgi:hypothetical protein
MFTDPENPNTGGRYDATMYLHPALQAQGFRLIFFSDLR